MSSRPRHVDDVAKRLREWSRACRKFRLLAVLGTDRISAPTKEDPSNGWDVAVYRHRDTHGREQVTSVADAKLFRLKLARLIREARARERRCDWDWFWWLHEYGGLITWDLRDDFDEVYTPVIEKGARAIKQHRKATEAAAAKRREIGDKTRSRVLKDGADAPVGARHRRRITKKK